MMENPEEILHSLEEFTKMKPKDIPRELEEYLCFVAKTGDPVYQWATVKSLFREKLINVITDFYESCPSVDIPPCPNVELFNYDIMKNFILEKLDTFAAAPFTVQRICELLTTPRKEYNRIDKYMRALEKNILVVSTVEPGGRRSTENGDAIMNGLESEHVPETSNCSSNSNEINVEEMDETTTPQWQQQRATVNETVAPILEETESVEDKPNNNSSEPVTTTSGVICRNNEEPYVSIEPVEQSNNCNQENSDENVESVTITAIPAGVQKRRSSVEPPETPVTDDDAPQTDEREIKDTVVSTSEQKEADPVEVSSDISTDSSSGIENISPETSTSSPETLQQNDVVVTSPQHVKEETIDVVTKEEESSSSDDTPDTTKCSEDTKLDTNDNNDHEKTATTTTTTTTAEEEGNDSEISSTILEEKVDKIEREIVEEIVNEVTSESIEKDDNVSESVAAAAVEDGEATHSEPTNQEMEIDLKMENVTESGDATTTDSNL